MLFVSDVDYCPVTHVLTVRLMTPSRNRRVTWQYRDVPPALAREVEASRPHYRHVLAEKVVRTHPARREGQHTWREPEVVGVD